MTNPLSQGYAIRREGQNLVFTLGRLAHLDVEWKILSCMMCFGTPRMNPVRAENFGEGSEYVCFRPGGLNFRFSVEDWNRSVLPYLIAHGIPAMPGGGFRGEDFSTDAQELTGLWQPVAELLTFVTLHKHDRACDMADLLELGGSLMGQLGNRRLFASGNSELVVEQVVGALKHLRQGADVIVRPAGSIQRQLLWLAEKHWDTHRGPLCWAESVFGLSIALLSEGGSKLQNVLWTDTPVRSDLLAPVNGEIARRVLGQLEEILDGWNENKNGQVEQYDHISSEQTQELKDLFAAEVGRLSCHFSEDS